MTRETEPGSAPDEDAPAASEGVEGPQGDDIDGDHDDAAAGTGEDAQHQAPAVAEAAVDAEGSFVSGIPWYTAPAILLGVPAVVWILTLIAPEIFFDRFVWKYFWGPIKSDAFRAPLEHNGIVVGSTYNVVNTIAWAGLLGVCLLGAVQMLNALRIRMDNTAVIGATLWVVSGSIWHVMQDTRLFDRPLEYFYITPPIYLMGAAMGIVSLLVGVYAQRVSERTDLERGLQKLWLVMAIMVLVYTALWAMDWSHVTVYVSPITVAVIAVLNYALVRWWVLRAGHIDPRAILLLMSLGGIVLSLVYTWMFTQDPWSASNDRAIPESTFLAPGLAAATALLVYLVARWRNGVRPTDATRAFMKPMNLAIVFSQMVDAFATSIGIDLAAYTEKHVLSKAVIDGFRKLSETLGWEFGATYPTFLGFASLKLAVSLLVVWAIDVYSKEDVQRHPTVIALVKFAIIMVGIGPGVRDFVRLSLGV